MIATHCFGSVAMTPFFAYGATVGAKQFILCNPNNYCICICLYILTKY